MGGHVVQESCIDSHPEGGAQLCMYPPAPDCACPLVHSRMSPGCPIIAHTRRIQSVSAGLSLSSSEVLSNVTVVPWRQTQTTDHMFRLFGAYGSFPLEPWRTM